MRRRSQGASASGTIASRFVPTVAVCGLISAAVISGVLSSGVLGSGPSGSGPGKSYTANKSVVPTSHVASSHPTVAPERNAEPAKPLGGVLVAWARVASLPVYSVPGQHQPEQSLPNPNNLGAPLVLLVNNLHRGWVQAYLPERPNESLGWTLASDVEMVRDHEQIVVTLSTRRLELLNSGKVVFQSTVAVGSPQSPTPTGHFYVTERLKVADPVDSAYGPFVLGLSGFSNTYATFDGGPGQIAIHGTDEPWEVGQYASHGCVRLSNSQITALFPLVQVGTPVVINA